MSMRSKRARPTVGSARPTRQEFLVDDAEPARSINQTMGKAMPEHNLENVHDNSHDNDYCNPCVGGNSQDRDDMLE